MHILHSIRHLWTARILPLWRALLSVLWRLFLVLAILVLFKYLFFTNCLSVQGVNACITLSLNDTSIIFTLGGLLLALFVMIPTFWIESKIKDASDEVKKAVLAETQDVMQKLSQAQMLIFEADKYQNVGELLTKEVLIDQAVSLWPQFKQEEYRKLGNSFSLAVIGRFYQGLSMGIVPFTQATSLNRDQIRLYVSKAIFYLEETIQNAEAPSREELVNLACIYGCAVRYSDMIRTIESAIKVDENVKDDFQEANRLSLLVYACGMNRQFIEKLGKKIGKELPLSKQEFVSIVQKVDLRNRSTYIDFFAVRRQPIPTEDYVYVIKMTAVDNQGHRLVNGLYLTLIKSADRHDVPLPTGQQISIEEFFDEVDKELFIICSPEE